LPANCEGEDSPGRGCDNVGRVPLALVTGASTGIGRATALRLAANGWTVLAGVRDPGAGEALVELAATSAGAGSLTPLTLDVTDPVELASAAEHVARVSESASAASGSGPGSSAPGALDALVNNAGIAVGGPLELVSAEDLRRQFEVNVFAQVAVTQALLPALRNGNSAGGTRGRIVFVSSIGGRVAMAFTAPYAASKHAIEALADALRVELRSSGVRVALVEPGSVATPIWDKARDKARSEAEGLSIPPELEAQYRHAKVAVAKALEGTARRGVPAESAAEAIERALLAERMRARYVVGNDARAMLIAKRMLPDLVFDRVVRRALGV
jgi:NAD(P)-dependent dehydrogenase (short-subunit alcohol dehydrogenase family)